jgi:hypothetical protein
VSGYIKPLQFEYTLNRKKDLKLARQKIEDETPISSEEARELRSLAEAAYKDHDAVIKIRQEEIARLKLEVTDLRARLEEQPGGKIEGDKKSNPLPLTQARLLKWINDRGGVDISTYLIFKDVSDGERLKVRYDIDELSRRSLIREHFVDSDDNETQYDAVTVTPLGRKFLVENANYLEELVP